MSNPLGKRVLSRPRSCAEGAAAGKPGGEGGEEEEEHKETTEDNMEKKPSKPPKPLKILANLFQKSKRSSSSSSSGQSGSLEERGNQNHRDKTDNGNWAGLIPWKLKQFPSFSVKLELVTYSWTNAFTANIELLHERWLNQRSSSSWHKDRGQGNLLEFGCSDSSFNYNSEAGILFQCSGN